MYPNRYEMDAAVNAIVGPVFFHPSVAGCQEAKLINEHQVPKGGGVGGRFIAATAMLTLAYISPHASALEAENTSAFSVLNELQISPSSFRSNCIKTTQAMVEQLKAGGMPIATIAEIVNVERKTVYSWLDSGVEATRGDSYQRLSTLTEIFSGEDTGTLRFFSRFWERELNVGFSLKAILTAQNIDKDVALAALYEMRPSVLRAMVNDRRRKAELVSTSPASHLTLDLYAATWS